MPVALRHLREARDYIAQDNPAAADALVAGLMQRAELLTRFPLAGRIHGGTRRIMALPPTPYSLIYRVHPDRIAIHAVWHGARQWPPAG
ncbi:type II toxin-antitoxin system RelE/ParE family toxin [Falsiroseomonas tokyonensis]|uniref:Type II toxin-antitoxin system RelE/ParE family toxin n=1 Tax=Falsiroseomonas tokyonensis TaxID=430521 RepID=A0ABV7BQK5_9PROT|nr:type II toxin-antitoxin system RelE/ParE family toxin [Falsiroseomonas tokyonensis]MBU8537880.1 type II toxin-antitoxin system RelE/ParE family toxin [Falsiroseomonas tokyonensis]